MIVGVDEAGRGPLAGVVTACALYLPKEPPANVRDSKELTAFMRQNIFGWLAQNACCRRYCKSPGN
jgi:ribonuclease HII